MADKKNEDEEDAQWQKTIEGYAAQLGKITGTDIRVITATNIGDKGKLFLGIPVGDPGAAGDIVEALEPLREKARFTKGTFTADHDTGEVLIPVTTIEICDFVNGDGVFFERLKTDGDFVKTVTEIREATNKTLEREEAIARMPHLTEQTAFSAWFVGDKNGQREDMQVPIYDGDFAELPPKAVIGALSVASMLRGFLRENKDKIGSDNPANVGQLAGAADIDQNPNITDEKLAAWLLAKSMNAAPNSSDGNSVQVFDNNLSSSEVMRALPHERLFPERKDDALVLETARKIFYNTMPGQISDVVIDVSGSDESAPLSSITLKSSLFRGRPRD